MSRQWFEVQRFPDSLNLSEVNAFLIRQGVKHHFTEEQGEQVLWMADESERKLVCDFIDKYLSGEIQLREHVSKQILGKPDVVDFICRYPVTVAVLLLGLFGYLIVEVFQSMVLFKALIYWPLDEALLQFQPWRIVTPVFLHFGIGHFVLNAVWLVLLGRNLENYLGVGHYLGLFLVTAIAGNTLQFYIVGANNFGGLSGVVYGYVGAFVAGHWLYKDKLLAIQDGLLIFFIVMLFVSFTGALDWFAGASFANWAHLGGFIAGVMYLAAYLYFKKEKMVS